MKGRPSSAAIIRPLKYSPRLTQKACPAPRSMAHWVARNSSDKSKLRFSPARISRNLASTGAKAEATSPPALAA